MASKREKISIRRAVSDIREKMSASGATAHLGRLPESGDCYKWARDNGLLSRGNPEKALADYGARIAPVDEAKPYAQPGAFEIQPGGVWLVRRTGSGKAHILENGQPLCRAQVAKSKYVTQVNRPGRVPACALCLNVQKTDPKNDRNTRSDLDFYRTWEWKKARYHTIKRWGSRCMCCGSTENIVVDHIKPLKKFPHLALNLNNLQVLCRECNMGKSNDDYTDWRPSDGLDAKERAELEIVEEARKRI